MQDSGADLRKDGEIEENVPSEGALNSLKEERGTKKSEPIIRKPKSSSSADLNKVSEKQD